MTKNNQSTISFTSEELKDFPLLDKIQVGMNVIALPESSYEGLGGVVTDILYGENRETENETILDIVVDFEEFAPLHKTHPHLNGTGIDNVFMGEDELAFYIDNTFVSAKGQLYCEECHELKDKVVQYSEEEHAWTWTGDKYEYSVSHSEGDKEFYDCGHFVEATAEDLPKTPKYLTEPLTLEQMREWSDDYGYVEAVVVTSFTDLIEGDRDDLLDTLSLKITNSILMTDMDFSIVGSLDEENLLMKVSGSVSEILGMEL